MIKKFFIHWNCQSSDVSGDDKVWDDSSDEEILPPSWDADEDVPEEDWDRLFKDSDSSDDFDGF